MCNLKLGNASTQKRQFGFPLKVARARFFFALQPHPCFLCLIYRQTLFRKKVADGPPILYVPEDFLNL